MKEIILFLIGSGSMVLVFFMYIKWLILYSKLKKCNISKLFSKGIIIPFYIEKSSFKKNKEMILALNRIRKSFFAFGVLALIIALIYNLLHEIMN